MVGTDALFFVAVGQTPQQLAGDGLTATSQALLLEIDYSRVAGLGRDNVFTGERNTFSGGQVLITDATDATSQSSGALVINGGVGIGGNLFCNSSYVRANLFLQNVARW